MLFNEINIDFSNLDSSAWTIFIVGWIVVFIALILLSLLFQMVPNILGINKRRKYYLEKRKAEKQINKIGTKDGNPEWEGMVSGQVTAAIGYALYLYFNELHDEENRKLTVVHKSRKYSPWNSKIYNVMSFKR